MSGKVRVTRTGNAWKTYYWSNNTWQQATLGTGETGDVYVKLRVAASDNSNYPNVSGWMDNVNVVKGDGILDSRSSNDGIIHGNEGFTTTGRFGNSLSFDGQDDYVSTKNTNIFSSDFTYSLWFNANDGIPDAFQSIFGASINSDPNRDLVQLALTNDGKLTTWYYADSDKINLVHNGENLHLII